jgi:hypothetical protein
MRPLYGFRRHRRASLGAPVTPAPEAPAYGHTGSPSHTVTGSLNREGAAITAEEKMANDYMTVRILPNETNSPGGKLADAELLFHDGPLSGLKLIGFAVWERRSGGGRNVTFPARQYQVNSERRSFALLRPVTQTTAQDRVREAILQAHTRYEADLAKSA